MMEEIAYAVATIIVVGLFAAYQERKTTRELDKYLESTNDREMYNDEILSHLMDYLDENPDIRFGQALRNLGIITDVGVRDSAAANWETPDYHIDRQIVHEEPSVTLRRVKKALANQYENVRMITGRNNK